jgi:Uncharacterised nucleotidyltransferase
MSLGTSSPAPSIPCKIDCGFSPEFELLLACCSVSGREFVESELRDLEAGVAWPRVLQLAEHHSVLPLMYRALRNHLHSLPLEVRAELQARYEANARKNLKFTAELFRILDCLEADGIPAIPYKGPVLAETVYGDLALRDFSDLDVLVRPSDVRRAKSALQRLGYTPSTDLSSATERAYLATGYEYIFDGSAGRNLLEVQWNIVPRFYAVDFSMDRLFERASPVTLAGRAVRHLSPEDLLLTLCVHAAKHAWIRLRWLRDIAGILKSPQLNWRVVEQRARDLGIWRMVGVSLVLAHGLLEADLPEVLHKKLDDREVESLCAAIAGLLPTAEEFNAESPAYFRLMIRLRERPLDKLRFLFRLALTPGPGEWNAVQFPAALFPLYRVVRVFRLLAKLTASGGKKQ